MLDLLKFIGILSAGCVGGGCLIILANYISIKLEEWDDD